MDLIETFADDFFERIEDCVNNVAWTKSRHIYAGLEPSLKGSEMEMTRFIQL